jgi:hypothetical protein
MDTHGCQLVNGRRIDDAHFSVDSGQVGHGRNKPDQGVAAGAAWDGNETVTAAGAAGIIEQSAPAGTLA